MDTHEEVKKADGRRSKFLTGKTPAQSFRLGMEHGDKLRLLADHRDMFQAELLRELIDGEWDRIQQLRKQR